MKVQFVKLEIIKLCRPAVLGIALGYVLLCAAMSLTSQYGAHGQYTSNIRGEAIEVPAMARQPCSDLGLHPGVRCEKERERGIRDFRNSLDGYLLADATVGANRTVLGGGAAASNMMASLGGFVLILVIAALGVTAEWDDGTAKLWFSRVPRRTVFALTKGLAIAVFSFAVWLASWLTVWLVSLLANRWWLVPTQWSASEVTTYAVPRIQTGLVVILAYVGIAVGLSLVLRTPVVVAATGLGVAAAMSVIGSLETVKPWLPTGWIAGMMDFHRAPHELDHFWVDAAKNGSWVRDFGLLTFLVIVLSLSGMWRLFRRDPVA